MTSTTHGDGLLVVHTEKIQPAIQNHNTQNNPQELIPRLRHITLPRILSALDTNLITSADLVKAYTLRIQQINHEYNAILQLSPDAVSVAHALDAERHPRGRRGLLHGIPILLKDNMPTLDGTDTCAGSLALVGARPRVEAAVVTALRSAGAVVLGKTNMAEWSGFRSTSGCSGWSGIGGQTRGVYYPGQKCSGSSSGSAVAVALGLAVAALGTETCWSIVSPAEKSGVVGFKPTRDLLPSQGIIHASERQDTVGVLTRSVQDASLIAIGIVLETKHHANAAKLSVSQNFGKACWSLSLRGIRIGIPTGLTELISLPPCKAARLEQVLTLLTHAGATIVRNVHISGAKAYEALSRAARQVSLDTDIKLAINAYLASLATNPQNINTLSDVIDFTKRCPGEEYPQRNVEVLERAQATDPSAVLYQAMDAKDGYFAGEGGIAGALCRHGCDVLLAPMLVPTMQAFAAKAGAPVLSVPVGVYAPGTAVKRDEKNGMVEVAPGIPFSAYLFGRVAKDDVVLQVGYVLEELTKVRERLRPYLEPSIEIERVPGMEACELVSLDKTNDRGSCSTGC